jgi:pyrimidine deaminase RibD-like protein
MIQKKLIIAAAVLYRNAEFSHGFISVPLKSNRLVSTIKFGTIRDSGDVAPPPEVEEDSIEINGSLSTGSSPVNDDAESPSSIDDLVENTEEEDETALFDKEQMQKAIQEANSSGGERGSHGPFPKAVAGAVIVTKDGRVIGRGKSSFKENCIEAAFRDAGINATPLREWCVGWISNAKLRNDISESTLYVTLEPTTERQGESRPPITQLIELSGIPRIVIGAQHPIPEYSSEGAAALHAAGMNVIMGVEQEECEGLIAQYSKLANSKLQVMSRKHFNQFGKPLGFLHCSVVDSDDVDSFARNGNAFGKNFGGQHLSYRDFGSYELAPPPETIWAQDMTDADEDEDDLDTEIDDFFTDFEDEDSQDELETNPMMPWYEQVDAVVATFPRRGNGPHDDDSVTGRLNGLKWLATNGNSLPANVERVLVMDATDLPDLPLSNNDPNLPKGVDIEAFWKSDSRKPSRILLRHGDNAQAVAAAKAASEAAKAAAGAAEVASQAILTGDAERAAEAALKCQEAALAASKYIQKEIQVSQGIKEKLIKMGVQVETTKGGDPVDIMNYLGKRSGYKTVVWRAGCWGERGVQAIMDGAFQWVSAHLAVDAVGGKFWQLMLAERAVQAACGVETKVRILAEQEDFSLEYCDELDPENDCELAVDGKPIRHVRLDCRVAVVDEDRPRSIKLTKTAPMKERLTNEAPWFL